MFSLVISSIIKIRMMNHRNFIFLVNLTVHFMVTSLTSTEGLTNQDPIDPEQNDLFELSVIHLNDFHARFVETDPKSGSCREGSQDKCVGGIARIYTASHQLVRERPNAIFLNAGDNFKGTLWYKIHRWNITATFLNMLPQDAMTIGNHEFDDRIAGLGSFMKTVTVPVVVTKSTTKKNQTFKDLVDTGKLKFLDEVETVNAEAKRLKNRGVNIIVVLSHCGLPVDRIMAANCPNVDIIVGGHSHTFLYSGTPPESDVPEDKYPVVVTQRDNNRTVLIVQAAAFSKYLGNITVWFDTAGEIVNWEGNPILLDSSVQENPEVLAALAPWKSAIDVLDTKVIGYSIVQLTSDNCRLGECNLGNLITDAMVDAYVNKTENKTHWTYAAVACMNPGSIFSHSTAPKGYITYSDAVTHQQFENTWDVLELLGSDLIQLLEYSVLDSLSSDVFIGEHFLQWSGICVIFNLENKAYSRVISLKIRCRACEIPIYEKVVLDEWYRIIVPTFLVLGGDGHKIIKDKHRNHEVGRMDIDHYVQFVGKMSPITSGIDGRIILDGKWRGMVSL